eukprot:CAMPEP_0113302082 /NCGR_PEP_ID=MMETSP0010_2-20120614/3044_1 /TAXON_ID=216773 ORGANISM="Corethron hystrix, Strain 308" /NCGR_SAMPLE_ID=MMETSP0010_2 /ASSEMBLY_ACC=CAM_ASM_000155 /LENGTH=336 /DNA_ID=CAMNT_0000155815 /DNA_START=104 /DNA_END=1119 /DNA_ORIENTATION=+ /assembly_acc=CAM_ASM_000155
MSSGTEDDEKARVEILEPSADAADSSSSSSSEEEDTDLYEDDYMTVRSIYGDCDVEEEILVTWKMGGWENIAAAEADGDGDAGAESQEERDGREMRAGWRELSLSTQLEPDRLAPLFSGAEWAGEKVQIAFSARGTSLTKARRSHVRDAAVDAAILATEYLHDAYGARLRTDPASSLLELGCGLGAPGMLARLMGASAVVLTDVPALLSQLERNVARNFPDDEGVRAAALDWSRPAVRELLRETGRAERGFDVVLNCDCVFEHLYGTSWKLLVEVVDELLRVNPRCVSITSVERRNGDGIDAFLEKLRGIEDSVTELVFEEGSVQIYTTVKIGVES